MKVSFHPEAAEELGTAVDYYEEKEIGLGHDFASEIYEAITRAALFPSAWPIMAGEIRRSLVNRFPFGVLYYEGQ